MKRKILFGSVVFTLTIAVMILCSCGNSVGTVTKQPITDHTHTYSEMWTQDTTHHWHAATCDHTSEVSQKGVHEFDSGTVLTVPTETTEGKKIFNCIVCGYIKTQTLPKTDHVHTYSKEWTTDETSHWHVATCEHDDAISSLSQHQWNGGVILKEATDTEEGKIEYTCVVCRYKRSEILPHTGHVHEYSTKWTYDDEKHWHAAVCHDVIADVEDHDWSSGRVKQEATEEEEGIMEFTCVVCGYSQQAAIPQKAHTHKYATEWSTDDEYHWHAATCDHTEEYSAKAMHDWVDIEEIVHATDTIEGQKKQRCSICMKERIVNTGLADHEHTFSDIWAYNEEYHWHPATCGHYGETLEKATHTWDSGHITKAATKYESGERTYTCSVCGGTRVEEIPEIYSFGVYFYDDKKMMWCSEKNSTLLDGTKISVESCECNVFSTLLENEGDGIGLSGNATNGLLEATINSFDQLGLLYATFLGNYTISDHQREWKISSGDGTHDAYMHFFNKARMLFENTGTSVTSELSYQMQGSAIIGINRPFSIMMADNAVWSYENISKAVANLFGYSNVVHFTQYAQVMANVFRENTENASANNSLERTAYNGAIYTQNGYFVLPFAFENTLAETVLMFVIVDPNGVVSAWINRVDSALNATDYDGTHSSTATNITVYGRCMLFESNLILSDRVLPGEQFDAPIPEKEGYRFAAWKDRNNNIYYIDANKRCIIDRIYADMYFTPDYRKTRYITFYDEKGLVLDRQALDNGETIPLPTPPYRSNYVFNGWREIIGDTLGGDYYNGSMAPTADVDKEFVADYTRVYLVKYVYYVNDEQTEIVVEVREGEPASANAPSVLPRPGYTIIGWDKSNVRVTENMTVTMQYAIKTNKVTFRMPDGSILQEQVINYGDVAVSPDIPDFYFDWSVGKAYSFTRWILPDDVDSLAKYHIIEDTIIQAEYTLEYNMPVLAVNRSENLSVTIYMPTESKSYKTFALNFEIEYKTGGESSGRTILFEDTGRVIRDGTLFDKESSTYEINNNTRKFTYAWATKAELGINPFETQMIIESIQVIRNGNAQITDIVVSETVNTIVVSEDDGETFQKITPVVIYR